MYEQEKQRAIHLMMLLCFTIFAVVLTGESILLGWETGAVLLILLGLASSWAMHITRKIPDSISLWWYFLLMLLAFFFYGIHETSIYDLAPVMATLILLCSATENEHIVTLCVATYFLTMCYDFAFVLDGSFSFTTLTVTRLLLHFLLVYMSGRLSKIMLRKHRRERKMTEGKIAELEEANRRTEDFLTNVSHELRTPINAVTGITTVMLKNEEDAGKRKDIFAVQSAGQRLFSQIEDILDYTEIDTGKMKVSEDSYMVSSLLNDIIAGMNLADRENMPELIFDLDARIPAVLIGDGRKVKKILKHLIDNAVKFTKEGGVYVRVYSLRKAYGVNLCIKVSDTGIGIDEDNLDKITERFYQSSRGRDRRAGGLGLGLPIVYGLVAAMEGFVQIESAEGSGTTVSVSIPQKIEEESPGMAVENRSELSLACFLKPEKYKVPEVRDYYNQMIKHLVRGLDIPLHRASGRNELERIISAYQLTHLFLGQEEYQEDKAYFEGLEAGIEVIVIADDSLVLPPGSRVKHFRKPFYCLPLVNLLNAAAGGQAEPHKGSCMSCPGVRVLVVDDEPMNLMVAEGIFKGYQMEVKTAESGMKAIALCEKEAFDLIFLDHMMPEMDGVETMKRLRRIPNDAGKALTIVAFTANAVSGAREMFLREGFDEFVSKPIEDMELERVLKKLLPKASVLFSDEKAVPKTEEKEETEKMPEQVSQEDTRDGRMTRLENNGINTRSGLQYCRGDMEFYEELLLKFAEDAARKEAELDDFLKREDMENYRIRVHAVKSTAKMVGADELSEMARRAEDAAKNGDAVYVREHHGEILDKYREATRCIREQLGGNMPAEPAGEDGGEISKEELLRRMESLRESLDTFEADKAETLLREMSGSSVDGVSVGGLLQEVRQDIEDFEFGAAAEKVEALIDRMKGGEAR